MPKLLQINIVSNMLSTGKIAEDISKVATSRGWDCYIAYGRWSKPGICKEYKVGSKLDMYAHYAANRFFDMEGLVSKGATKSLVKWINNIKPDIVQLHNLHDHYLNYPELFECLAKLNVPVFWTQHDCWAFTGGCTYPDLHGCEKWKYECKGCSIKKSIFCNKSEYHYRLKVELLSKIPNLIYIPVSNWLCNLILESSQGYRQVIMIHNGIDINRFKPTTGKSSKVFNIIGVAASWCQRKGLDDFIKLRSILSEDYTITLVGLTSEQVKSLPQGITGITRTTNIEEMVALYSEANVFLNPTYSDNFPTTNIEALACGTPVITYKTGGSPEAIDEKTGIVVEQGNLTALVDAIVCMKETPLSSVDCRKRAEEFFDKDKNFAKYVDLYEDLIKK